MSRPQRRAWWIFAGCAAVVAALMLWVSTVVVNLERAVVAEADHQSALRLALWRMDSWLAPKLSREAARPSDHYQAYYSQDTAYTKSNLAIPPGEVLTPSPLLSNRYDFFPLHFQYDAAGGVTSPQVPLGRWLDLQEGKAQARVNVMACTDQLTSLRHVVPVSVLANKIAGAEKELVSSGCLSPVPAVPPQQQALQQNDYLTRAQVTNSAKQAATGIAIQPQPDAVRLGPLLPMWIDDPAGGEAKLLFVRRVQTRGQTLFQGAVADWPALREALLGQAADVLPTGSALTRLDDPTEAQQARMLATIPALLTAPVPAPVAAEWSATHSMLLAAWIGMIMVVGAVGFTLRSTMALGERRARFASAVTHELRTPLTTFRMYSEMLADEMVQDPAQRASYLATLRSEADRLSRLVENVLSFARLEEGRYRGRSERVTLSELLDRVSPPLQRRAEETKMQLEIVGVDDDIEVDIDIDAVAQILFNLVDNACKYSAGSESPTIELTTLTEDDDVILAVRDYGPGISKRYRTEIFRPFERGEREAGDNKTPGVGLGLALARGLAQDLGGSLDLDIETERGARFTLRLPRRPAKP